MESGSRGRVVSSRVLREAALGAMSGALAGFLFGVSVVLIQTSITDALIAKYGYSAVDHGASFLQPVALITMSVLGSFLGLVYAFAHLRASWLGRVRGLLFAAFLTLVLLPLLVAHLDNFSAIVTVTQASTNLPLDPFAVKTASVPEDVAPPQLLGLLLAALVFLEGLGIRLFAQLGARWIPRLHGVVYAVIATGLALPGLAYFGLLVIFATGLQGGE